MRVIGVITVGHHPRNGHSLIVRRRPFHEHRTRARERREREAPWRVGQDRAPGFTWAPAMGCLVSASMTLPSDEPPFLESEVPAQVLGSLRPLLAVPLQVQVTRRGGRIHVGVEISWEVPGDPDDAIAALVVGLGVETGTATWEARLTAISMSTPAIGWPVSWSVTTPAIGRAGSRTWLNRGATGGIFHSLCQSLSSAFVLIGQRIRGRSRRGGSRARPGPGRRSRRSGIALERRSPPVPASTVHRAGWPSSCSGACR